MNLCYSLAAPLYRRKHRQRVPVEKDVLQSSPAYWKWQFDSSAVYFSKFSDLREQLKGKRVLDIGCGLGGRTSFLATSGATEVVGIDINAAEIEQARQLAAATLPPEVLARLRFETVQEESAPSPFPPKADPSLAERGAASTPSSPSPFRGEGGGEGAIPSPLEPFDIAILVDSLEHVRDPVAMLNVAYSHLKPGGLCYFGTVGWYHYNAAHLITVLPIPFATLFFSDATILDAVRRIHGAPWYVPTMWDSDPPVARWVGVQDLRDRPGEYLNKITIRGIRRAMARSQFGGGHLRVAGFTWSGAPWLRWLNVLAWIPGIREAYHSGCFGRLVRGGGA